MLREMWAREARAAALVRNSPFQLEAVLAVWQASVTLFCSDIGDIVYTGR